MCYFFGEIFVELHFFQVIFKVIYDDLCGPSVTVFWCAVFNHGV